MRVLNSVVAVAAALISGSVLRVFAVADAGAGRRRGGEAAERIQISVARYAPPCSAKPPGSLVVPVSPCSSNVVSETNTMARRAVAVTPREAIERAVAGRIG